MRQNMKSFVNLMLGFLALLLGGILFPIGNVLSTFFFFFSADWGARLVLQLSKTNDLYRISAIHVVSRICSNIAAVVTSVCLWNHIGGKPLLIMLGGIWVLGMFHCYDTTK